MARTPWQISRCQLEVSTTLPNIEFKSLQWDEQVTSRRKLVRSEEAASEIGAAAASVSKTTC